MIKLIKQFAGSTGMLAFAPLAALAHGSLTPITPEEVARLQAQATRIETEANEKRLRADRDFEARNAECYHKILMSSCLEKSRKQDVAARVEIRQMQAEVRRIQREIRLRETATEKAAREAEAPQREAEAAEQAARNRQESERREAEFARREAEHQKREQETRERAATDAAAREKRDAEAAARDAQKAKAARERAAKMPPPAATSAGKPYTPPPIDIPPAPGSLAPQRN